MAYSQAWLEDPTAIRGILVVVNAAVWSGSAWVETPKYLSNIGYMTSDASVSFNPIISGGVQFTESLTIDGSATLSFGDIQLNNQNGDLDAWLDSDAYVWVNRAIQVYLVDPTWVCTNLAAVQGLEIVFDGVIADIDSSSRESINIKVRDKLERLNTPLTENILGTYGSWAGGQSNKDAIKPLIFGEVFNVEPLLMTPSPKPEYMFSDSNSELLIEIRDNGVPIYTHNGTSVTKDATPANTVTLSTGSFIISYALAGVITISAQGVKNSINMTTGALVSGTYANNIANLICLIATQYGKATTRLTANDLDLVNLAAFATANTQSVGTVVTDRTNTLLVCQELAASIGAQVFMTRKGKLQLLRIGAPTTDTSVTITDTDMLHHSLNVSSKVAITAATTVNSCKNWLVQSNIVTGIPPEHKTILAREFIPEPVIDTTVKNLYKLEAIAIPKNTVLIVSSEAASEATRLNAYYKVPRIVYKFTGLSKLMSLKLGQPVILQHNRFNLTSGKAGQVISLSPNWLNSTIEVEVII